MPAPSPAAPPRHAVGFNLAAIAALVALGAVALAYAIDAAARSVPHAATQDGRLTLTRTIGGKDLEIPAGWFRYDEQRIEGFAKQIDLKLSLPIGPQGRPSDVEVTLVPSSRVRASARLLDGVYLHQFQPEQLEGAVGLIGKPLKAADGFVGETVWYDPISSAPFVAKCAPPVAEEAEPRCLRTVQLGPGLAAVYAFSAEVLENWRRFDPEMRKQLARIGI